MIPATGLMILSFGLKYTCLDPNRESLYEVVRPACSVALLFVSLCIYFSEKSLAFLHGIQSKTWPPLMKEHIVENGHMIACALHLKIVGKLLSSCLHICSTL